LVKRLLPVIPHHGLLGIAIGINLDAFRREMDPHPELKEMFGNPYTACFQWTVQTLINMLDEYGDGQRVAFFHECNDYQEDALKAFGYVRRGCEDRRAISISFGSKGDFVPLQAADVLAYEGNHIIRDPDQTKHPSWGALDPEKDSIRFLHYGEGNMKNLISTLHAFRQKLFASGWDGKVV
jgi:hypothetical protein